MEKFRASNGMEFATVDVEVRWASGYPYNKVSQGLREFFQHERDQELGRWRWPEDPHLLVYVYDASVLVVDESRPGLAPSLYTAEDIAGRHGRFAEAARAYFAAHPEPKPWHSAVTGEVWELDLDFGDVGKRDAFMADNRGESVFRRLDELYPTNDSRITAARRIWPEGE